MGRTTDGLSETEFKERARRLREALGSEGMPKLGHSRALEVLSRVHGYANWHAVQAGFKAAGQAPVAGVPETVAEQAEPKVITLGVRRGQVGAEFALYQGYNSAYEFHTQLPYTVLGVLSTIDLLDRMGMAGYAERDEVRKLLPVISEVIRNPVEGEVSDGWKALVKLEGIGECWDFDVYKSVGLDNEVWRFGGKGHWYLTAYGSRAHTIVEKDSAPVQVLKVIKSAFGHYPGHHCTTTVIGTLRPVTRAVLAREM